MKKVMIATGAQLGGTGGIASYVCALTSALTNMGVDVGLVAPIPRNGFSWETFGAKWTLHMGHTDDPLRALDSIHQWCRSHQFHGIINNDNAYVQSYAPTASVPFVSVCHLDKFNIATLSLANAEFVDYSVAISEDMKANLLARKKMPESRVVVVHTGVEADLLGEPISGSRSGIVFLGGGVFRKGADLVAKLLPRLDRIGVNETVHWFGNASKDAKRLYFKNLKVNFHGHVPRSEVMNHLRTSKFLLFPSRSEGCPMALLEGMALGVVPIAGDGKGAMREIVRHNENGFLFPLSGWVRNAIDLLGGNSSKLHSLSLSASETVRNSFLIEQTANSLLSLLENPTVDRSESASSRPIRWHRIPRDPSSLQLIPRLRYRLGLISRLNTEWRGDDA